MIGLTKELDLGVAHYDTLQLTEGFLADVLPQNTNVQHAADADYRHLEAAVSSLGPEVATDFEEHKKSK